MYRIEFMMPFKLRYVQLSLAMAVSVCMTACQQNLPLAKGLPTATTNLKPIELHPEVVKQRLTALHEKIRGAEYQKEYHQAYLKGPTAKPVPSSSNFGIKSGSITSFVENFAGATSSFGDGTNGWTEWGGDYARDPAGSEAITLHNPQNQTGVLQTGISKTIPINAQSGDYLIAKMKVATTFTADSDTTLVLYFNDANQTVAVSDTARGTLAGDQTLFIETPIPAGATQVTIAPLVYLAQNEQSSLLIDEITVDQIPGSYYTNTVSLNEPLDSKGTNSTVISSHKRAPRFLCPKKEASVYPEITTNQGAHRCFSTYTISSKRSARRFHGNEHGFWAAA